MKKVYLDHNATTPTHPEVVAAMRPYLTGEFGNPSSLHAWGQEARGALERARALLARALGAAHADTIVFTAGGTEADNLALLGVATAHQEGGRHLVVSSVEHHAVLGAADYLALHGFEVTRLRVDSQGLLDPEDVRRAIRPDTILVSLMHANNETGVLFPVAAVGQICRERRVLLHTDAVQTFGKLPLDVARLGVDLLSVSGHKLHGPKGIGALFIRRGVRLEPLLHGGGQERSRRPGTQNVPAAVGFAKAVEILGEDQEGEAERLASLRDRLEQGLMAVLSGVVRNGHPTRRLPHTANLAFAGAEAESLILALDLSGVAVSSGAACSSGSLVPSHVLTAMGLPPERVQGSVRFSLGRGTTLEEIEYVLEVLPPVVERARHVGAGRGARGPSPLGSALEEVHS
jgi:cysteine desulfurase